jgi:hypothetical protein
MNESTVTEIIRVTNTYPGRRQGKLELGTISKSGSLQVIYGLYYLAKKT